MLWPFRGCFVPRSTQEELEEEAILEGRPWYNNVDTSLIVKTMPVEVRTKEGASLFTGRLDFFSLAQVVISRIPGTFNLPVLEAGTEVMMCGYDKDMETVLFQANVSSSTMFECRLENLRIILTDSRRTAVRLPLFNVPAELYVLDEDRMAQPLECNVVDISTTGACVISEYCYPPELTLRLRVELAKGRGPISFPCKIARETMRDDNTFEYGLIFARLDQQKYHCLVQDMQAAKEQIKAKLQR